MIKNCQKMSTRMFSVVTWANTWQTYYLILVPIAHSALHWDVCCVTCGLHRIKARWGYEIDTYEYSGIYVYHNMWWSWLTFCAFYSSQSHTHTHTFSLP